MLSIYFKLLLSHITVMCFCVNGIKLAKMTTMLHFIVSVSIIILIIIIRWALTQVAEATIKSRRAEAAPIQTMAMSIVGAVALSSAALTEITPWTACEYGGSHFSINSAANGCLLS